MAQLRIRAQKIVALGIITVGKRTFCMLQIQLLSLHACYLEQQGPLEMAAT